MIRTARNIPGKCRLCVFFPIWIKYILIVPDELETAAEAATCGLGRKDLKRLDGRAIKLMGRAIKEEDPRRKLPCLRYVALCSPAIGEELREIQSTARRFELVDLEDNSFSDVSDDLKAARIAADHIGSTHHELLFTEDDKAQMFYTRFETPLCEIILAGNRDGLSHLHLNTGEGKRCFEISGEWIANDGFFADTRNQIEEYFAGKRTRFEVIVHPRGTEFQQRVWGELLKIPYGELRTYKDIAIAIGNPKAVRAVGMANGKNPIPLIIPCHRVIGSNGTLVGFAQGLAAKERLIKLEHQGCLT